MNDYISRKDAIETIHKTIYQFFDICGDDEEVSVSDKDKLLLNVNKLLCKNIREIPAADVVENDLCCYEERKEDGKIH